jgi:uncharacterized membrane protein YgcG
MDKLKHLLNHLRQLPQRVLALLHKEQTVENNQAPVMYTEEQLMARLKFFIGICLSLTLFGIVFVVLYSLIFVTQPLNAISPIDQKFFELIVPIATFLTGTLSGIMLAGGDKDAQKQALTAANAGWSRPPSPAPTAPSGGFGSGATTPTTGFGSGAATFGAPAAGGFGATGGFNTPAPSGFGGGGFGGAPATPAFGGPAPVAMTASGKAIVPEMPQPEL